MFNLAWKLAGAVVGLVLSCSAPAQAATAVELAPTHLLVKFNETARIRFGAQNRAEALAELRIALGLPGGARFRENGFVQAIRATGRSAPPDEGKLDFTQFCYLDPPPGWSPEKTLTQLAGHHLIEYVEADGRGDGGTTVPDDTSFSSQWHHRNLTTPGADIRSTLAWDTTRGSSNVILAVLDTGLNLASAEFTNRIVEGYDFVNNDTDPSDDHGHGTAVTATAAATGNNAFRVAGVDWHCRIMPVKVLDAANSGLYSWWASAINYAVTNGAKVINLSAGGSSTNLTLARAILNAINSGTVFVTITHNDGTNLIRFPGRLTECITVGSTTSADQRASTSNYGPEIDLVAPGQSITTIGLAGGVQTWSGTSFAAPMVSGAACLLASLYPGINHADVRSILCAAADDRVGGIADTEGFDEQYGWGRLNLQSSLLLLQTSITNVAPMGDSLTLSWASPANASNKAPYLVEFAAAAGGPWQAISNSLNFLYSTNATQWLDDGTETMTPPGPDPVRLYRVRVNF